MDTTRAQQQALDDELVAPADHLNIGKSNLRLSSTLKSKESTLQVVLDALKLTPFYNAFEISADVPEIYMQEFWVTVSKHHSLLHFKLNGKSHTVNVDNFRDMLKICPKLPGQQFEEPPLEEDIISFIRDLGHTGEIKFLSDVNVYHMHQPWRSFAAIINKCLSGKTTALESLHLLRAQILWGMYHNKKVDYVYLLWEDLVFQVENKNSKKNNDIRRLLKLLKEKRIKSLAKGDKADKKKQPAETFIDKGLIMLSDVPLTEAEQLKLVIERSKTQTHSSPASDSGRDEGTGKSSDREDDDEVSLNDDANDDAQDNDNQDDENQDDDDDEQTDSDNDGDDFVHPNDEEVQGTNTEEEDIIEEATHEDDEVNELYGDVNVNLEGRDTVMMDAPLPNVQATQETEDTYVILTASINPDGQQHSSSMSSNFVSNMLNPRPDTGIDSIFYTKANSLVDVPVTTIAEPPLVFATNLPPPPTPLITHMQQTLVPTPTTVSSSSLQHLPNFGSLFGFDHRLKTLETDFSEFKQTNQFAEVVSSIPGIVEAYLANKMHETIKTAVQLQSERLIDEAQAENPDFLNKLDDNINKIIKDQVKEQVKAQVSKILLKIEKLVND
ncbi:hypothetical protein Tco_1249288 [Tanacetum coccineum]